MENTQEPLQITKCITNNSFIMDINTMKAPLFTYTNFKPTKDKDGNVTKLEEKTYEWFDSKNKKRKLYMYCKGRLPRQFESDTLFGIMGLFVKKNAPFSYNKEKGIYNIDVNKVEFSFYELCEFMRIPYTGYYTEKLREAIRILKQTQYFSYENGVFYDRKNKKYVSSGEEGMSLITKYKFKKTKSVEVSDEFSNEIDHNWVIFDDLILDNLRYEYMRYLNINIFFDLIPSGIERGIYTYLESSRYDKNNKPLLFIKRSYEVLKIGIPVEFDFTYILKRKLKKPLNHLKKIGYLKDFIFGDELKIDGIKEESIYFCFNITTKELKEMLEKKKIIQLNLFTDQDIEEDKDENNSVSKVEKEYLKLPKKELQQELLDKGLDDKTAYSLTSKYDKWHIIKYIIWLDKQLYLNKNIPNKAGLLRTAIEFDKGNGEKGFPIDSGYEDVIEFIEQEKKKEENNNLSLDEIAKKAYEEYIDNAVEQFKLEEPDVYDIFYNDTLNSMNTNIDKIIQNLKITKQNVDLQIEFKEKQEKSILFIQNFIKYIKAYRLLKTYEDFYIEFIAKNKKE